MVTVYSLPACVQCTQTKNYLKKQGVQYSEILLSEDDAATQMVQALGYSSAPVVIYGDNHWSGFRPDLIVQIKP
jgi:glutaredoxin-like protein NrdH